MRLDSLAALREREVVRQAFVVVQEVLSNEIPPITEAQHEVLVTVVRVVAHQVPEDRPDADVDQRLGDGVRVLPQTSSQATAEKDDFHVFS